MKVNDQISRLHEHLFENARDVILLVSLTGRIINANRAAVQCYGYAREELLSMTIFDLRASGEDDMVKSQMLAAENEGILFETTHRRKDGTCFPVEVNSQGVHLGDERFLLSVIRNITEKKRAEKSLAREAKTNAVMAELSGALVSHISVEDMSGQVLEHSKRLTGSRFGFAGYIDPRTGSLVCPTMAGDIWDMCAVEGKDIVFNKYAGLWGWVLQNKQPLLTNRPEKDPRSSGVPAGHIPIERFLAAPALFEGKLMGIVALANADRDYTGQDLALVEQLASLYALAIRRKWEEERMAKINECFLSFGADPDENINRLTALCGDLLGASSAIYNRLDRGLLCSLGRWRTPEDYVPVDNPEGHICYDLIRRGGEQVVVVHDLPNTSYALTDPHVKAYGLQTYVGHPVKLGNTYTGAVCVLFQTDFVPSESDKKLMGIIASAIGVEEERKLDQVKLLESRQFNLAVINSLTAHIAVLDKDGGIITVNEAWREFGRANGASAESVSARGLNYLDVCRQQAGADSAARQALEGIGSVLRRAVPQFSMEYPCHGPGEKRWFLLNATPLLGEAGGAVVSHMDITGRKKDEARQEAELAILSELANFKDIKRAINKVLGILTGVTGCDASAIRLAKGDDFTYFAHAGFAPSFIEKESSLCSLDEKGGYRRTNEGEVVLECLCGKVLRGGLSGRINGDYLTDYGSILVGSTSQMKDDPGGPLRLKGPWRLTCVAEGYETLVLVPIKNENQNIGVLQLNGRHRSLVTREDMPFLELVSRHIGAAIRHLKDEEALQESEERYRRLADNAPDIIYRVSLVPRRRFEYVNRAVEQITGYTPAELYADPELAVNLVYPADRAKAEMAGYRPEDMKKPLELRWVGKDGSIIWTEQRNLLISNREGQVVALEGIARDITERKKVEEARQKRALYDQTMNFAMSVFTGSHNRQDMLDKILNLLAERLNYVTGAFYGYEEWGRVLSVVISRFVDVDRLESQYSLSGNVVAEVVLKNRPLVLKNSRLLPASHNLRAGYNPETTVILPVYYQERILGALLLGTAKEVSREELKFLKQVSVQLGITLYGITQFQDLKTLSQQLAARQKEIESKNRALEQANRAKSEFLANMSHELRTPLNSVLGFSELLEKQYFGELNPRQLEYVKDIRESGEHLLSLINDILDLSKIEAGAMELDLQSFSLPELLQGSLRMLREKSMKKNIKLDMRLAGEVGDIIADPRKVKQVVFNLLSNALKFTPEGGWVCLSATREENAVLVSVSDNGIGIAEEELDMVFQKFSQVDGSLSRRHEGTGLGLALCKKLVEMHGGNIWVESKLGVGSTFTFSIPMDTGGAGDVATTPLLTGRREYLPGGPVTGKVPLVLVVEDNDRDAKLIEIYLKEVGYRVARAANGKQGFDMALRLQPQVITLDILMPVMDGWEFLEMLQTDPRLKNIPVIIVSVASDTQKGLRFGASEVLVKPLEPEILIGMMQQVVNNAPVPHAPATILVIDDDPRAVEIIAQNLNHQGHRILKAYGGAEGIQRAREEKVDLILLDLMMPEMNGYEVVKTLKQDPRLKHVPVIILTAKILTVRDYERLQGMVESIKEKGSFSKNSLLAEVSRVLKHATYRGGKLNG